VLAESGDFLCPEMEILNARLRGSYRGCLQFCRSGTTFPSDEWAQAPGVTHERGSVAAGSPRSMNVLASTEVLLQLTNGFSTCLAACVVRPVHLRLESEVQGRLQKATPPDRRCLHIVSGYPATPGPDRPNPLHLLSPILLKSAYGLGMSCQRKGATNSSFLLKGLLRFHHSAWFWCYAFEGQGCGTFWGAPSDFCSGINNGRTGPTKCGPPPLIVPSWYLRVPSRLK